MTLERDDYDAEVLAEWQAFGALIVDGVAHERHRGDQDYVRYRDYKGLFDSGKLKIVGEREDIITLGEPDFEIDSF